MRRRVRRGRALAFAGALGISAFSALAFLPPKTTAAAAEQFGGYDNFGFAAPVSVLVYEPFIPIPTEPQGELRYSYTEATLQSGPFGTSTASSVWPGATLATGLPQFNKNLPQYPIQATAVYPGQANQTSVKNSFPVPNVGPELMSASASATNVTASTQTGASSASSAVSFGQAASTTTDTVAASKVTSAAVSTVSDIGLMGSIIQIHSVHSEVRADSDGKRGTVSGEQTVSGLTVAGEGFKISDKGVAVGPAHLLPLPGMPKNGAQLLARLGITISQPAATSSVQGTHGLISSQALLVSIDTTTFHDALGQLPIRQLISRIPINPCVPQLDQLPTGPCLQDQLSAVLSLHPRVDFLIGNVSASANAVPQFVVPIGPVTGGNTGTTTTIAGTPGTPGTPGTAGLTGGTGDAPPPDIAPAASTSGLLPSGYAGIKTAAVVGALVALIAWYAARNLGLAVVGGMAGCEYGAPRTVPDLRRG